MALLRAPDPEDYPTALARGSWSAGGVGITVCEGQRLRVISLIMTIIEELIAEHTVFLSLFDQIELALPDLTGAAEIRAMARIVEGVLKSHADAEANLAYLALDHVLANKGHLDSLHHDHREIDARLERVHTAKTCDEARRLLATAMMASREHFRSEERSVFPFLEMMLKSETLRELGKARVNRGLELSAAPAR